MIWLFWRCCFFRGFEVNCFGVVEVISDVIGNVIDIGDVGLDGCILKEIFEYFGEIGRCGDLWWVLGIEEFLLFLFVFWFLDCWVVRSVIRWVVFIEWLEVGLYGMLVWENLDWEDKDDDDIGREDWVWLESKDDEGSWGNDDLGCWLKRVVE